MRATMTKVLAVAAIGLVAISGVATFLHFLPDITGDDGTAPDFTIETVRHGTFTLSEHRGETVVLDLMAVDCASCRITEKAILELNASRPNVTIVSVDIWTELEDEAYLDGHMRELGADWPYGMDTDELLLKYQAFEISKVVVVDGAGRQTWSAVGGITAEPLLAAVDEAQTGYEADLAAGVIDPGRSSSLRLGLTGFAIFAGVASFFAPCAFPLLPGYMAYSLSLGRKRAAGPDGQDAEGSLAAGRVRDAIAPGFSAAAGIFLVYGVLGLLVAAFGGAASAWMPFLQPAVGVIAIALGMALLAGMSMERVVEPLQRGIDRVRRRVTGDDKEGTLAGYFGYGIGYGAAAAGCVAPVFLQLTLTAAALGAETGLKIFGIYAGVSALLMIAATIVAVKARTWLQRRAGMVVRVVNRASGVVMILAGIYLIWFFSRGTDIPFL